MYLPVSNESKILVRETFDKTGKQPNKQNLVKIQQKQMKSKDQTETETKS